MKTSQPTLESDAVKDRYRNLLEMASVIEIRNGQTWYEKANRDCQALGTLYRVSTEQAAYVVATLSPLLRWDQNLVAAQLVLSGEYETARTHALPRNVEKCRDFLLYGELTLNGPKVEAFYKNLCLKTDEVTVDSLMLRAAFGNWKQKKFPRYYKNLEVCRVVLLELAKETGLIPHQLQAIIWNVSRRESQRHKIYYGKGNQLSLFLT